MGCIFDTEKDELKISEKIIQHILHTEIDDFFNIDIFNIRPVPLSYLLPSTTYNVNSFYNHPKFSDFTEKFNFKIGNYYFFIYARLTEENIKQWIKHKFSMNKNFTIRAVDKCELLKSRLFKLWVNSQDYDMYSITVYETIDGIFEVINQISFIKKNNV
jgi:hypothetical protein